MDNHFPISLLAKADASSAGHAVTMLLLIASLLAAFVFIVGMVTIRRWRARREAAEAKKKDSGGVDPWSEAGRRIEP